MCRADTSREEVPLKELKEVYAKKWGIELVCRDLKYTLGMNTFHSRKMRETGKL